MAETIQLQTQNLLVGVGSFAAIWMVVVQLDRAQLNLTIYDGMKSLFVLPAGNLSERIIDPPLDPSTCVPCLYWISGSGELLQLGKEVPEDECCPSEILSNANSTLSIVDSTNEQSAKQEATMESEQGSEPEGTMIGVGCAALMGFIQDAFGTRV